jgi:SagB-type dehydrogenase family enzyme
MQADFGDDFQSGTKYRRNSSFGGAFSSMSRSDLYKSYNGKRIPLSFGLAELPDSSFLGLLKSRRSVRSFSTASVKLSELAYLLWASTGIKERGHGFEFRTAPSAGALYPIETYIAANKVSELPSGLYHYRIRSSELEEVRVGELGKEVAHAALNQEMCAEAPIVLLWTAIFNRSKWKYRQRAYRYVYLDAGHIAQNLALSATSIGLGSCQIGAFYDDELNNILGVDGKGESVVYLSVIGHPA